MFTILICYETIKLYVIVTFFIFLHIWEANKYYNTISKIYKKT